MLICTFLCELFMQEIDAISSPYQFDCNQMQQGGREIDTTSLKNVMLLNVMEMKNGYSSRCKKKF